MNTKNLTEKLTQNGTVTIHYEWDHGFSGGQGEVECSDLAQLIPACVKEAMIWLAQDCSWHITNISGYLGDVEKLQDQIDKAVDDEWHRFLKIERRKQTRNELKEVQDWLNNIDTLIESKKQQFETLKKEVFDTNLQTIREVFEESSMRVVSMKHTTSFGETVVRLRVHLNDLRFAEITDEELVAKLKDNGVNCLMEYDGDSGDVNGFRIKLLDKL